MSVIRFEQLFVTSFYHAVSPTSLSPPFYSSPPARVPVFHPLLLILPLSAGNLLSMLTKLAGEKMRRTRKGDRLLMGSLVFMCMYLHLLDMDLYLPHFSGGDLLLQTLLRFLGGSFIGFYSFKVGVYYKISDLMTNMFSTSDKPCQCSLTVILSRVRLEDFFSFLENLQMRMNAFMVSTVTWIQDYPVMPNWIYCTPVMKFLRSGLWELRPDTFHSSFRERVSSTISSLLERSRPPSYSNMERTFSSSSPCSTMEKPSEIHSLAGLETLPPLSSYMERPCSFPLLYSFVETLFKLRPQIYPHVMDNLLAGLETLFPKNSTKTEFKIRSDLITTVMLFLSDQTYTDFYEILQDYEDLKMRLTSIYFTCFYLVASWAACSQRVFKTHIYLCILEI